jgi:mono/diheme cytochrome c family protein
LETRFIVRNTNGVYGMTYRWTTPPTNAILVAESGLDEAFTINDGGNLRTQIWRYPSRSECLACHTPQGGFALGFNTAQLNTAHDYNGAITNQIEALRLAGYFSNTISNRHLLRTLAHATNDAVSLEYRVRSYFAANCVQCHQPGGPASLVLWDARISTPGPQAGIINGPLINNFGDTNNRVVVPGSLANSILYQRVANLGAAHMPPLATSVVNTQAVSLLSAWIMNELPGYASYADWQSTYFGSTNSPDAAQLADPDNDAAENYLEYLTQTNPTNSFDAWAVSITLSNETAQIIFPQIANRGFEVQSTANFLDGNSWKALDILENAPWFSVSNRTAVIPDFHSSTTNKFYRVRVYEP